MKSQNDFRFFCHACKRLLGSKQTNALKMLASVGGIGRSLKAYCPTCWPGAEKAKKKVFNKKTFSRG